jgi:urease alpha subunit
MNSNVGVFGKLIVLKYLAKRTFDPALGVPIHVSIYKLLSPHCMDLILTDPGFSGCVSAFTILTY